MLYPSTRYQYSTAVFISTTAVSWKYETARMVTTASTPRTGRGNRRGFLDIWPTPKMITLSTSIPFFFYHKWWLQQYDTSMGFVRCPVRSWNNSSHPNGLLSGYIHTGGTSIKYFVVLKKNIIFDQKWKTFSALLFVKFFKFWVGGNGETKKYIKKRNEPCRSAAGYYS